MRTNSIHRPLAIAIATCLCASAAHAQTTGGAEAPPSTASATDNASPADIVVTATKRAENVQNVPISITAITSDLLARQA